MEELSEGQIIKTNEQSFVLVRATKDSSELVAIEMDILMAIKNSKNSNKHQKPPLSTPQISPSEYLIEFLSGEEITELIQELLNELIDQVVFEKQGIFPAAFGLTAEEIFKQLEFDLSSAFDETHRPDVAATEPNQQIFEEISTQEQVLDFNEIETSSTTSKFILIGSQFTRRMPRFNQLTKLQHDLREFERQLDNVAVPMLNYSKQKVRQRKQMLHKIPIRIDYEVILGPFSKLECNIVKPSSKRGNGGGGAGEKSRKTRKLNEKIDNSHAANFKLIQKEVQKVTPATPTPVEKASKVPKPRQKKSKNVNEFLSNRAEFSINTYSKKSFNLAPHSSDEEATMTSPSTGSGSLRCNYCQKQFLTGLGLNKHMKNCNKINEELSKLIDEGLSPPLAPAKSPSMIKDSKAEADIDIVLMEKLKEMGEGWEISHKNDGDGAAENKESIQSLEELLDSMEEAEEMSKCLLNPCVAGVVTASKNEILVDDVEMEATMTPRVANETPRTRNRQRTRSGVNRRSCKGRRLFNDSEMKKTTDGDDLELEVLQPPPLTRSRTRKNAAMKSFQSPVRQSARLSRV